MKRLFTICLFCFKILSLTAQVKDVHSVYWLRYHSQLNFTPKILWSNEIDNRRFIDPNVQLQLIYHSRLHYKTGRWDYGGGLTLSWAFTSKPEKPITHPTNEVRPVVEVSYETPFKKWALQHRIRLDNRFIEEERLESFFGNNNYTLRFRYRIQARVPLHLSEDGKPLISLKVADEIMFNHRENLFDQNRIYVSSDFVINKKFSVEAGYIYIYQQRFATENFLERHVARLSLIHKLLLY